MSSAPFQFQFDRRRNRCVITLPTRYFFKVDQEHVAQVIWKQTPSDDVDYPRNVLAVSRSLFPLPVNAREVL